MSKKKKEKIDGRSPDIDAKLRSAIRQVWSWSHARRLCIQRATGPDGFPVCEECKQTVPKVFPDHKIAVGVLDGGFIDRMFVPSSELQALCKTCHGRKTRQDNKKLKMGGVDGRVQGGGSGLASSEECNGIKDKPRKAKVSKARGKGDRAAS